MMELIRFIWFLLGTFKFQIIKAIGLPQYIWSLLLPWAKSIALSSLSNLARNACTVGVRLFCFSCSFAWFVTLLLVVAVIKSLRTRYHLVASPRGPHEDSQKGRSEQVSGKPTSRRATGLDKIKELLLLLKDKDQLIKYLGDKVNSILPGERDPYHLALSHENIGSIHRQLSWSDTQLEFESVNWINDSVRILWPSLQTLVDKLLRETLRQTKCDQRETMAKKLDRSRDKPKLSFYLSCRRKLNLLRKYRQQTCDIPLEENAFQKTISLIISMLKIFLLHFKQFVMDQIFNLTSIFTHKVQAESEKNNEIEVDMRTLLQKSKRIAIRVDSESERKLRTQLGKNPLVEEAHGAKSANLPASKPGSVGSRRLPTTYLASRLLSPNDLIKKREFLANKIDQAQNGLKRKKTGELKDGDKVPTIADLDLGDNPPEISAIKFIERDNNLLLSDAFGAHRKIEASDLNNKKLLIEVTFDSGQDFCLRLSSIPILDTVQLTKFKLNLRLMVRINRTNFNLDENLEVFERPDQVLYPVLNYVEVSLVDVPKLDWHLESGNKKLSPKQTKGRKRRSTKSATKQIKYESPLVKLKRVFTPTKLINHSYFKYLIHVCVYLVQLWFQPFDIRLGETIYIKSLL